MTAVAMKERVFLVTGATSGIGRATALGLARLGARVVAVARNEERGKQLTAALQRESNNDAVELLVCDLSSQASIRNAARDFKRRFNRLDVLVNQAGLYSSERVLTVDGIEQMFAVNHLAYFLLTNLLTDVLKASAPARVVNGTGGIEAMGEIRFDDISFAREWKPFKALSQSKLGNVLFTHELARRLKNDRVSATCFHPGGVKTNLGAGAGGVVGWLFALNRVIGSSVEKAAEIPIRLATAPELEGVTGQYFNLMKPVDSSARSRDPELQKRFWALSEQLTGLAAQS